MSVTYCCWEVYVCWSVECNQEMYRYFGFQTYHKYVVHHFVFTRKWKHPTNMQRCLAVVLKYWRKGIYMQKMSYCSLFVDILHKHVLGYNRQLNSLWRHQMETFSALLAICAGNSPVPVSSPHKGQWRGALMLSLICVWINGWVNNGEAGDMGRYRAHYDVTVM